MTIYALVILFAVYAFIDAALQAMRASPAAPPDRCSANGTQSVTPESAVGHSAT